MSIVVERDELARALAFVTRSAAKADTVPILGHLLVKPNGSAFSVMATNMDMQSECDVPAEINSAKPFTVPAADLLALVNRLPEGGHITLGPTDTQISVKMGRANYKLHSLSVDNFPAPFALKDEAILTLPGKDFARAMDAVHFAVSKERHRYYMCGICIGTESHPTFGPGRKLYFAATDGHMLGAFTLDAQADISRIIVPDYAIPELIRLSKNEETVTLGITNALLRLTYSGGTFTTKLIDGDFPDFHMAVPRDNKNKAIFDIKELAAALERLGQIDNRVKLDLSAKGATLSAINPDKGSATEELECEWDSPDLSFKFAGYQILAIISAMETELVAMFFEDAGTPVVLRPYQNSADQSAIYVNMPLR